MSVFAFIYIFQDSTLREISSLEHDDGGNYIVGLRQCCCCSGQHDSGQGAGRRAPPDHQQWQRQHQPQEGPQGGRPVHHPVRGGAQHRGLHPHPGQPPPRPRLYAALLDVRGEGGPGVRESRHLQTGPAVDRRSPGPGSVLHHPLCGCLRES